MGAALTPVIGITSYLEQARTGVWNVRASFLPDTYITSITAAGGTVMVLPPQELHERTAIRIVHALDGLVLSGGADIDPERYGEIPLATTDQPRRDRDAFEIALFREAQRAGIPILGICRGAQLINVALGGSLIQHVPDVVGHTRYQHVPGEYTQLNLVIAHDSQLARALISASEARSPRSPRQLSRSVQVRAELYHHQAISRLGEGLTITSRTPEGIPESIELADAPFVIGVQWHPEQDQTDTRLFHAFIAAARKRQAARSNGVDA